MAVGAAVGYAYAQPGAGAPAVQSGGHSAAHGAAEAHILGAHCNAGRYQIGPVRLIVAPY